MAKKPKAAVHLDLDAFRETPPTVSIDGKDYPLAEFSLGNVEKFAELKEGFETADLRKQAAAAIAVYTFIVPDAPSDKIRRLGPSQQKQLADFWLTGAIEKAEEQEAEAKSVVADPTPPG